MTRLADMPEGDRPRERLSSLGAHALSDAELLALLLCTGTREENALSLAQLILSNRRGLRQLSRASPTELRAAAGVGPAKASRIVAAFELGRRASSVCALPGARLRGPGAVARMFSQKLRGLSHERLEGLYLDSRGRLLASRTLAVGTLNSALVQPREVFAPALAEGAAALVLVHNHPSGDPSPSDADAEFTRLVAAAGELFGVPLLDHVIVAEGRWLSMRRLGLLAGAKRP